ncbi:MAG: hypothetical protein DU489_07080 [Nitrosomonas sp.]|uniref:SAP domain-containing protein n=1 Tax=Nitrosomonas sp. TaxID=42353 RepID=UPI0032EEE4F2
MLYKTNCAVLIKGDRVGKGKVVDISPELAERLGADVVPVDIAPVVETKPEPEEKPLDEMSHDELKAKAESLGVKKSGSIADLRERITLHLAGKEELQENNQ